MILQLDELGLRRVRGDEGDAQLQLLQLLLDLFGRPLQARNLVPPGVEVVLSPEVNGDVRTTQGRPSGRLQWYYFNSSLYREAS